MENYFKTKLIASIPDKDLMNISNIFIIKNPKNNEIYVLKNRLEEPISDVEKYVHYNELSKYFMSKKSLMSQKIVYDPKLLHRPGKELLGIS